jgi:hypothetical protein
MDETALRLLISGLDQHLSSLEGWLHFWTLVVIIGCAGEMYFVLHAYLGDRKNWFNAKTRGFIAPPEKPSGLVLILEILSIALVVVGISGELYIDRESGDLQTQLRVANGKLTLLLEREAGDAKHSAEGAAVASAIAQKSANDAVTSASTALKTVGTIKGEVDSAKSTADIAKGEVDGAKRDADAVSEEVKNARAELNVVESFVSSRHVVDARPFDKLKPFKKRKLGLVSISGDEEAREFCLALADKLKAVLAWKSSPPDRVAEWPIAGCGGLMGGNAVGISVRGPDKEFVQAVANAIRDASGVPVATSPVVPGRDITDIVVGAKSPGFFK